MEKMIKEAILKLAKREDLTYEHGRRGDERDNERQGHS